MCLRPGRVRSQDSAQRGRRLHAILARSRRRGDRSFDRHPAVGRRRGGAAAHQQRSLVKVQYVANRSPGGWRAHGRYLSREGAQREGARGLGFDASGQEVVIEDRLGAWQKAGDRRLWKVILSPEEGHRLDLRQHTRGLLTAMETDLGTRLEWVAIDHHNTAHAHVHVAIRGRDEEGRTLAIPRDYVREGIRARSQELATRRLGYRTPQDRERARERAIEAPHFGELDAFLERRAGAERFISFEGPLPSQVSAQTLRLQLIGRLKFLESLGLAEQKGTRTWRLSELHRPGLRQIQLMRDVQKSVARGDVLLTDPGAGQAVVHLRRGESVRGRIAGTTFGALEEARTRMQLRDRVPIAFSEVQRMLGKPVRVIPTDTFGMVYKGRLVAYGEDETGERFALIEADREIQALPTERRDLAPGTKVRARLLTTTYQAEASEQERRRGLMWQLADLELERDHGRGR